MQTDPNTGTLILASASPRRRELLGSLGIEFSVQIPAIDETPHPGELPRAYAERLAAEKAAAISAGAETIVVAADTIVVQGTTILGKPTDESHAFEMLTGLSGKTHEVITGVCVKRGDTNKIFSVSTEVLFRTLEKAEIISYIATGCPMDKAGAYAIQGGAAHMVKSINGSYTNVVGLPLCELYKTLNSF
ncbi:MAG: Maf family protein [Kiritimatiellaceae bacterium]|nr:Maf family protein [Kiritimatiellaceae bacterium]